MRKTLTLALAVALFGILAAVVVAQVDDEPTVAGTSATTETVESAPTQTTPERTTTTEDDRQRVRTDTVEGEDISGPCDEAEHAGDPRCNGAVADDRDRGDDGREDNSGPGSSSSGHDDSDDVDEIEDDSSGSGHGGGGGEDSSGHGGDDD